MGTSTSKLINFLNKNTEWSEGLKLMLIVLPTTMLFGFLTFPLLKKYNIVIPPVAVGGGIELMMYDIEGAQTPVTCADSVSIQQKKAMPSKPTP